MRLKLDNNSIEKLKVYEREEYIKSLLSKGMEDRIEEIFVFFLEKGNN